MMGRTFGKRSAIRAATAAIFIWRTLPAPRRWARRIWAQLTLSQEALRFQSSYSCIAMANIEIMFNINYNIQEIYSKYIQ